MPGRPRRRRWWPGGREGEGWTAARAGCSCSSRPMLSGRGPAHVRVGGRYRRSAAARPGQERRLRQSRRSGGGPRLGGGRSRRQFTGRGASSRPGAGSRFAGPATGRLRCSSSVSAVAPPNPPMPGLVSAMTTCRPAGPAYVMIIALAGSCWSSCCSTRNSRERCMARASDSLSPAALDVVIPQAVLVLTLVLTDSLSLVLRESPVWTLRETLVCDGSSRLPLWPCPVLRDRPSLSDHEVAVESADPVVLV